MPDPAALLELGVSGGMGESGDVRSPPPQLQHASVETYVFLQQELHAPAPA